MAGTIAAALLTLSACRVSALTISDLYSPRNRERPARRATLYILLHTTEGPAKGSLSKVRANGECHYLVNTDGRVYRIIDRIRVAFHAGRSMWEGRTNLDEYSIGIEVVGYHDRDITQAQYAAVRELLGELQRIYKVPDVRVLPHSMIAYGAPNRWHPHSHRGRKRCGMCFARSSVRARLGLTAKPSFDPDVRAGRLVAADPYLEKVLYAQDAPASEQTAAETNVIAPGVTAWDIARDSYASADTVYVFPSGRRLQGSEVTDWTAIPAGTRVEMGDSQRENVEEGFRVVGGEGMTVRDIAGEEIRLPTTFYFFPDGRVRNGAELSDREAESIPAATKVLVGYTDGGYVKASRRAFDICGALWNSASTIYRMPDGTSRTGDTIDENTIPANTRVFFRN